MPRSVGISKNSAVQIMIKECVYNMGEGTTVTLTITKKKWNTTQMENEIYMIIRAFLLVPTLNKARAKTDLIKPPSSTKTQIRWDGERRRGGKREGSGVFQVMAGQLHSASLWGGTPDSEGEPYCSISTLLHFLSLKLLVLEGAWKSILTLGGRAAFLPAGSVSELPPGRSLSQFFLIIQI